MSEQAQNPGEGQQADPGKGSDPANEEAANQPAGQPAGNPDPEAEPPKSESEPAIYRPEGLPDHMVGANDQETINNLFKGYKGARDELAGKKNFPDKIDDYKIELSEEQAEKWLVKNEDGVDPIYERLRKTAFERGIDPDAALAMVSDIYEIAQSIEGEKQEAMDDFAGEYGDGDMSFESYGGPEKAKPVQDANVAWLNSLQKKGILTEDQVKEATIHTNYGSMLSVLDALRVQMGEKPIPSKMGETSGEGGVTEKGLQSMMRDPRYWRDKDPEYISKVTQGFQELYGEDAA